jgi:5-methylcytosine-specific restriction endonuclease McrA
MAMSTKRGDPRLSRAYRKARLDVLSRDGFVCHYCGQDATTADHVIPIKAGGDPISLDNMVACCVMCNSKKGSRSEGVFLGGMRTPPIFSSNIYPMQSRLMPDSPFSARPIPIDGE